MAADVERSAPDDARSAAELVAVGATWIGSNLAAFIEHHESLPRRALVHLESLFGDFEVVPDPSWWRDYLLLTGVHAVLTDEGWEPWCDEHDPEWVHDEVNAPVGDAAYDQWRAGG